MTLVGNLDDDSRLWCVCAVCAWQPGWLCVPSRRSCSMTVVEGVVTVFGRSPANNRSSLYSFFINENGKSFALFQKKKILCR